MGVRVEVGEGESLASAMRRLRRYVRSANVEYDRRWHAEFTKACEERRRRKGNAKRRKQYAQPRREAERERRAAAWPEPPRPGR